MNTFYSGGFSSRAKYPGGVTNAEQLKKKIPVGSKGRRTREHVLHVTRKRKGSVCNTPLFGLHPPRGSTSIQYVATVYNVKGPCTSATLVNRTSSGSFARKDPRGSCMSSIV